MRARWRAAGIVVICTTALVAAAVWQAGAQLLPPSSSTTAPPATSSPTTRSPVGSVPKPSTTIAPKPSATTLPPRPTTPPPTPPPPTTTTTVKPGSQTVPSDAWAQINAVKRTPGNSTVALIKALQQLEDFGLTPQEAINVGFGHFPVAGLANWSDDWLMPRFTPSFHMHQGNDIFAAPGTPIRAVNDGTVRFSEEPVGGKDVYLNMSDGTYFFCAHAADFAPGLSTGSKVKQGTVIGFVGDTGDAQGGASHCHFEFHPKGGAAVNPKGLLDGWINEALANVPKLVASYQANAPKAIAAAGFIRRFDTGDEGIFSAPSRPPAGPLLWASSVNPAGGTIRLAQAEVAQAAGEVDWEQLLAREQEHMQVWQEAHATVVGLMAPLAPAPVANLLSRGSS